ncbi:MAG: hypothetical protein Kow0099_14390 [Candidatus Abyssubacteria bacterium]
MEEQRSKKYYIYYALFVLFRRKWAIAAVTFFFFFLIFLYSFLTTPLWEGTAKVLVDYHPKQQLTFFPDINSPIAVQPEANPVNDLVSMLTSQDMARKIVEKFDRDEMLRRRRENPETLPDTIKKFIRDALIETPKAALAALGVITPEPENYLYDAIDEFMEDLQNIEVEEDTNIIDIAIYGESPKLATDMANAMAAFLLDEVRRLNQDSAREAFEYASEQIHLARAALEEAEADLDAFRKEHDIVQLDQQIQLNLSRLDTLTDQRTKSISERKAAAVQLAEIRSRIDESNQRLLDSGSIIDNPTIVSLRSELDKRQMELASMLTYKKDNHPDVVRARAGIREAEEQLRAMTGYIIESQAVPVNDYMEGLLNQMIGILLRDAELAASIEVLGDQIARAKAEGARLSEHKLTEARLLREVQLAEGVYDSLKNKMLEFEALVKAPFGDFDLKVVDHAYVFDDQDPDWPLWVVNLIIGLIGGVSFGIATAFVLEFLSDGCRTVEDTEQRTGLPVVSVVNRFKKKGRIIAESGPSAHA